MSTPSMIVIDMSDSVLFLKQVHPLVTPDEMDEQIARKKFLDREEKDGPRLGDFIIMTDGSVERFSYDWGDSIQTSKGGSWYLGDGYSSFSGGLNEAIPKKEILNTGEHRLGKFWFFHHDYMTAHNAVSVEIPCRLFAHVKGE